MSVKEITRPANSTFKVIRIGNNKAFLYEYKGKTYAFKHPVVMIECDGYRMVQYIQDGIMKWKSSNDEDFEKWLDKFVEDNKLDIL